MPLVLHVDESRLLALGHPGGSVYMHFLRVLTQVDAKAKHYLTNDMVNVRTGNLRSSFSAPLLIPVGGRLVGTLENTASYAQAVHEGTRPHEIRSRSGGMLRFPGVDGQPVFRASVQHPGTKGRPFLRRALEEVIHGML